MTSVDSSAGSAGVRRSPLRSLLVLAVLVALPLRAAGAQGTWEIGVGRFKNAVDTQSTSGVALEFARWPGGEKTFQHGFHLAYFWGREDSQTHVPPNGSMFSQVIETWGSWTLGVGMPFRIGPANWPVRPFLEAEPGGMLYRSLHLSKYYRNGADRVGLIDESVWMIGPSLGIGAGLQVPGSNRGPRLQVRADYRGAYLLGGEAVGVNSSGFWSSFGVKAGMMFTY